MKLTKSEEQGLRLVVCLAARGTQMTLPEISEAENLSEALVAKVLGKLRTGGVIVALRGRNGGYVLGAEPEETTVAAILRALGKPVIVGCFSAEAGAGKKTCHHSQDCGLRPIWERLEERVTDVLEGITLADLLQPEEVVRAHLDKLDAVKGKPKKNRSSGVHCRASSNPK